MQVWRSGDNLWELRFGSKTIMPASFLDVPPGCAYASNTSMTAFCSSRNKACLVSSQMWLVHRVLLVPQTHAFHLMKLLKELGSRSTV